MLIFIFIELSWRDSTPYGIWKIEYREMEVRATIHFEVIICTMNLGNGLEASKD